MRVEPLTQKISITVEAKLYPSEDPVKVKEAIKNLVKDDEICFNKEIETVEFTSEDSHMLNHIYEQLRSRRTLAAARRFLRKHTQGECTWLYFNKQAAYADVLSICETAEESPMGPIIIKICCEDVAEFIKWLAQA